jgi:hypothetical protein
VVHIHAELARLYRAAKAASVEANGSIAAGNATRLAMILSEIRRCISEGGFEARLEKLEQKLLTETTT